VLINADWSPYAAREEWPVPDHPIVKLIGENMARRYFPQAIPAVFKHFASPLDGIRKRHGLKPVGSLLEMLTAGDTTLYPDDSTLTPLTRLPTNHHFIGPVIWEPAVAMPDLDFEDPSRPLVYVTLGSSGKLNALPTIIEAVSKLSVNVVVATAARKTMPRTPAHVRVLDFVPGSALAERAALVISNGGSTTGYQALAQGTPVLGIPSNFDQFLATEAIVRSGAGLQLPARSLTSQWLTATISQMLDDARFTEAARAMQRSFARYDSHSAFRQWVENLTGAAQTRAVGTSNHSAA
jgi:UDP:flavonoid glycosyltransferase YjiC (YdhE family)